MPRPSGRVPSRPDPPLAVALDLDGTLLWNGTLADANREAVATLRQRGVRVVIATGKHPLALWPYALRLGLPEGPHIALSGACITNDRSQRETFIALSPEDARTTCDLMRQSCLPFAVFAQDAIRIDRRSGGQTGALDLKERLEAVGEPATLSPDPLPTHAPVGKILALLAEADPRETLLAQRAPIGVHAVRSGPWFYDLGPAGHTKGSALTRIAQDLGIPLGRIWAMGDSENDVALLAVAAFAASFEGAPDSLRAHADLILPPGPQAVAQALAHLLPQWFPSP